MKELLLENQLFFANISGGYDKTVNMQCNGRIKQKQLNIYHWNAPSRTVVPLPTGTCLCSPPLCSV
jgi:hypothetical protein